MLVTVVVSAVNLLRMHRALVAQLLPSDARTAGAVSPHYVALMVSALLMMKCS
jgi:hypothetical protein